LLGWLSLVKDDEHYDDSQQDDQAGRDFYLLFLQVVILSVFVSTVHSTCDLLLCQCKEFLQGIIEKIDSPSLRGGERAVSCVEGFAT